jgi:hypothetical protein
MLSSDSEEPHDIIHVALSLCETKNFPNEKFTGAPDRIRIKPVNGKT